MGALVSLLLKRPELMLNQFFDDIFSESPFVQVFSGVIYTKISGIFSDDFYDKKIDFLRKGGRKLESRVKRPGDLE